MLDFFAASTLAPKNIFLCPQFRFYFFIVSLTWDNFGGGYC